MTLKLNKEIYPIRVINEAVSSFYDIVAITVKEKNNYWICEFSKSKYDLEETQKEFENYLIGLINTL